MPFAVSFFLAGLISIRRWKIKTYISGPVTGKPDFNRPAFEAAEKWLWLNGYEPVNPLNVLPYDPQYKWEDYMRADLRAMLDCEGIMILPGWEDSKGAVCEVSVAVDLGMDIMYWEDVCEK